MNHPVLGYLFVSPCIFAKPQMGSIKENPKKPKPGKFRVLAKPKAAETQKRKEKKLVRKKQSRLAEWERSNKIKMMN